jgi:hypothetical protein
MARGDIAKEKLIPGALLQKETPIVKAVLLIFLNCVENHRKLIKMQDQFCWIPGELYYNFCYSSLS